MDRPKGWHMATTEESISELLDQLNARSLEDTHFKWTSDHNYGAIPPLTTADFSNLTTSTITVGDTTAPSYTIGNGGIGLTHSNTVWTTSGTSSINWNQSAVGQIYHNPAMEVNQGGQVSLKGDNADIDINGKSLVKWMQVMEELDATQRGTGKRMGRLEEAGRPLSQVGTEVSRKSRRVEET